MFVSPEARLAWALPHKVRVGQSMLQTTERLRKSLDEAYDDQSDSCCWQSLVEGEEGNGWICMYNRAVLCFESQSDEQHQSTIMLVANKGLFQLEICARHGHTRFWN